MYALIGRVRIKPGHEEATETMARERGPGLVSGMSGSKAAYWARPAGGDGELVQHSFWLFESEADARAAETTFNSLRETPDAPAEFVSADVCEVIATK
jgi:heme-degrading monooxygenase HmoA